MANESSSPRNEPSKIKANKDEVAQKLLKLLPKDAGVLMQTMAEEWIEEGKEIGLKEGKKLGRQEAQQAMIVQILHHRFQINEEAAQRLAQQLAPINDEAILKQLVNLALDVSMPSEFSTRLQLLLPKPADTSERKARE